MDDRDEVVARVRAVLDRHPELVAAWLFGSFARGTERESSDVDVAVLYGEPPPSILGSPPMKLEGELEGALHRTVQVVRLDTAPPDLGIRVLREGQRLVENDRSARIRFEVRLRNVYWDLEPILRRCRKQAGAAR